MYCVSTYILKLIIIRVHESCRHDMMLHSFRYVFDVLTSTLGVHTHVYILSILNANKPTHVQVQLNVVPCVGVCN